jgi:transcriptional regulator with XRE-family HTH domain
LERRTPLLGIVEVLRCVEGKEHFHMIKRLMVKPLDSELEENPCGVALWTVVGRRLRQRRMELGLDIDHVARKVGISPTVYANYELGIQTPASQLAQIADLFDVPVVWFFQDVGGEEKVRPPAASPAVYRVATAEYRVQALTDAFRKLDLEGQQHLLAISKALSQSNPRAAKGGLRD